MDVITRLEEMRKTSRELRSRGRRIGLVPTMGFLHEGHASLIRKAREISDRVVVSIFVNPMQFGPGEDFKRYPRDFERDRATAEKAGADIIFAPEFSEVYPQGFGTFVEIEKTSKVFEGSIRPTHFRGVATVVAKLFHMVEPDVAVFGQKDAQQAFLIQRMVSDLDFNIQIVTAPIVREPDGLAMSSRNVYLKKHERTHARVLSQSLFHAESRIREGETSVKKLHGEMKKIILGGKPGRIDYIAFVQPATFAETKRIVPPEVLIAVAVRFGKTRLIDNIRVMVPA